MGQQISLTTSTSIQRRHIAFGVVLVFFSIALIIAEAKRPSSSFVGYWVYAVGWLSVILTTFLLYHAFTIFDHDRDRELPAPPIGFFMPDEVPKPPNYDQLSIRGDPPAYSEVCSRRSFVTPTPPPPPTPRPSSLLNYADRRRNRSSTAIRIPMSVRAAHRHQSHPRSRSRSSLRSREGITSAEHLERI
ncbi:hypothetical protein TcWFU_007025 [Taenia crassiceps]|uniref:Uncharacterized protein n=1 Tax=Taenia crassiceps TaxID=6207 RepID=A0ABR4QHG0_9CEST